MTDHLCLSASHPLLKTTLSLFCFLFFKLSKSCLRSQKKKKVFLGEMVWWHCWRTFPFDAPDFIPNSLLFSCQRKRMLRWRPGCTCKMFPISFLLFVPNFVPWWSVRMSEDRRQSVDWRDRWGTGGLESVTGLFLIQFKTETEEKNLLVTDDNEVGSCSQLKSNEKSMSSSKILRSNFCSRNVSTTK